MASNPAKLDDPKTRERAIQTGQAIESNAVRNITKTSDTVTDPIIAPSAPKDAEFWSTFADETKRPTDHAKLQAVYTPSDHEKYLEYKKKQLEQLQGESVKQAVREMYDSFKNTRNFAEMQYLEKEFPFLTEEKQQYVELQKWALEMLGEYYSTGGKPTQKMLEFIYAAKTDPNLKTIVENLNKSFTGTGQSFGTADWVKGWMTSFYTPKVLYADSTKWISSATGTDAKTSGLLQGPNTSNAKYWEAKPGTLTTFDPTKTIFAP